MAAPAEVSEKRSNFRIRQFKEKRLFNIVANLTLNSIVQSCHFLSILLASPEGLHHLRDRFMEHEFSGVILEIVSSHDQVILSGLFLYCWMYGVVVIHIKRGNTYCGVGSCSVLGVGRCSVLGV